MPRPWSYGQDGCLLQGELLEPPCFDSLEADDEGTEEQEDKTGPCPSLQQSILDKKREMSRSGKNRLVLNIKRQMQSNNHLLIRCIIRLNSRIFLSLSSWETCCCLHGGLWDLSYDRELSGGRGETH